MSKLVKMVYHGTTKTKAVNILKTEFWDSTKNTEWLGNGVYFFDRCKDAEIWARRESRKQFGEFPAIIYTVLTYDASEFFDLDCLTNMRAFQEEMLQVLHEMGNDGEGTVDFTGDDQSEVDCKIRCYCCNYYKTVHNIKIIAYSFPAIHVNPVGFSFCTKQRQYCVYDKACISSKKIEEATDYAV